MIALLSVLSLFLFGGRPSCCCEDPGDDCCCE